MCCGVIAVVFGAVIVVVFQNTLQPGTYAVFNALVDVVRVASLTNAGDTLDYGTKARPQGARPEYSAMRTNYFLVSITNKADVLKGVKPIVEDVGPYAFSSYTRLFRIKKESTVSWGGRPA